MQLKDLKIGDKILVNFITTKFKGITFFRGWDNQLALIDGMLGPQKIHPDESISKFETITEEKEIPIEKEENLGPKTTAEKWAWPIILKTLTEEKKEENPYWITATKTVSHPYQILVTTYHCPKCDKQLWGTCGMPIKQYANEPCQECRDKEKLQTLHPYICPQCHKEWGLTGVRCPIEAKYCRDCINGWKKK